MIRRLVGPLPPWAQRKHPVLRAELGTSQSLSTRARLLVGVAAVLVPLLLLGAGYLLATRSLTQPAGQSLTESIHAVVYWPLVAVQFVAGVLAVGLTINAVGDETRRQHWDNLRVTQSGAELALRSRWAAVFYRLAPLLLANLAARLVLVAGVLYDLTAFQGRYLDLLLNGIEPELSLAAAVVLLSLMMTAALLVPFTSVGLDAAFGLYLSTRIRQPTYSALVQVLLAIVRLVVMVGLFVAMTQLVSATVSFERGAATALTGVFGALGDGGLAYLNLGLFGDLWARAPYSILMSVGLLLFVLAQAVLSDQLVARAVRRAEALG